MECEHISRLEEQLNMIGRELHLDKRVKDVKIDVETLMGVSVSYNSMNDPESPPSVIQSMKSNGAL